MASFRDSALEAKYRLAPSKAAPAVMDDKQKTDRMKMRNAVLDISCFMIYLRIAFLNGTAKSLMEGGPTRIEDSRGLGPHQADTLQMAQQVYVCPGLRQQDGSCNRRRIGLSF